MTEAQYIEELPRSEPVDPGFSVGLILIGAVLTAVVVRHLSR